MTIEEVSPQQYDQVIRQPYHIFGSAAFNQLNADKAEHVHYLLFKNPNPRLGLIAGIRDKVLHSPFSAPFGGFVYVDADVRLQYLEAAVDALLTWAAQKHVHEVRITFPPPIYQECYLAKILNVFYRKQFVQESIELNYHFDLQKFSDQYPQQIWRNARKNLNQALKNKLSFFHCASEADQQTAYEVIRINRTERGVPLRMSLQQIRQTMQLIPADFFLVKDPDGVPIAAAIVFLVAPQIGQIIYWGDIPDFASLKTMNFLSFKVFEHYKTVGLRYLDIGYSTVNSIPNYGLCEFKEGLGCDIQPKISFTRAS